MSIAPEEEPEEIQHIGIKRRSGRYPWGSGEDPFQRSKDFKAYLENLKEKNPGITDAQISNYIQEVAKLTDPHATFTSSDLRAAISNSTEEIFLANQAMAYHLRDELGMSTRAIAKKMLGDEAKESTVRGWLKVPLGEKKGSIRETADRLKEELERAGGFLDVGKAINLYMGIADTKLRAAIASLRDEGYELHGGILVPQLGVPGKFTTQKVLGKPGSTWNDARQAVLNAKIGIPGVYSEDGGLTFKTPARMPASLPSKRMTVRYGGEGGEKMDGVIELRRGVPELSLGSNRYGQVRIAVDGTHFMKGMAMYADDLPPGVDVRFNTPKENTGNKLDALKPMKTDADGNIDISNPFGSTTHSRVYTDKNGKEHNSILNIVGSEGTGNVEGRWDEWARTVSSQMLSKQPVQLAKTQLAKTQSGRKEELDRIMRLTNPVVQKKLLEEFADSADGAAVHLKAAAFPRQANSVILPMNNIRPHEVYAPGFDNGDRVVLVRHPHGGPFEIPELTVNNNSRIAKAILGNAQDAIGIHHTVASQLSGADFDGDTVLVIPNPNKAIKASPALPGIASFEPKIEYKIPDGDTSTPRMSKKGTQTEMGRISNLITDMSLQGANHAELTRAIRHSMVVIDAEKHGLNYKQSEKDHNIAGLKETYQGGKKKGAATLISRAGSRAEVPQRKAIPGKKGIDPKTGARLYKETGKTRVQTKAYTSKRTGETTFRSKVVPVTTKGKAMEFAPDARELLSGTGPLSKRGTPMERVYADYANSMKDLGNQARKASIELEMPRISTAAKAIYSREVESLNQKLEIAQRNAPLERRAQIIGNELARSRIDANPHYDDDDKKKVTIQSLEEGRRITGAAKQRIYIEPREWEAIQAGAVAHSRLTEMLRNADMERVKELATPRSTSSLTPGQLARARSLMSSGRNMSDIARELGIPRTTLVDNMSR